MKIAWTIILISALTDFVVTAGTGLMTAMTATGSTQVPNDAVLVLMAVGGLVSAARTVQQALKGSVGQVLNLKGEIPAK